MKSLSKAPWIILSLLVSYSCEEQRPNNPRTVTPTPAGSETTVRTVTEFKGSETVTEVKTETKAAETVTVTESDGKITTITKADTLVTTVTQSDGKVVTVTQTSLEKDSAAFKIQVRNGKNCTGEAISSTIVADATGFSTPCTLEVSELLVKPVTNRKAVFLVGDKTKTCGYEKVALQTEHFCFPQGKEVFRN